MKKSIGTNTLLGVACLALMPMAPVYAANWVYVTAYEDFDYYYDSDTIRRSGNQVTVWEKSDYLRDKNSVLREIRALHRYDCVERTSALLQMTIYYPNGEIKTLTWTAEEKAVIPETRAEFILKAACR